MTRDAEEALAAAFQAAIEHVQGVRMPAPRAAGIARGAAAVRVAIEAVAPSLFDTEPADLAALLEQAHEDPG